MSNDFNKVLAVGLGATAAMLMMRVQLMKKRRKVFERKIWVNPYLAERNVKGRFAVDKNLCIVLGNESCDLDSAISSICLAYFYNKNHPFFNKNYNWFLSVLNVQRADFGVKTEVIYFFKQNNIDLSNIIFIDDLERIALEQNDIILVDHHVSPYFSSVIEVIDHRPYDKEAKLSANCRKCIDLVGSCCSLIAKKVLTTGGADHYKDILRLLRAPIILDTVNFSEEANKARELDIEVIKHIEEVLNIQNVEEDRQIIFKNLVKARSDISLLNSYELLLKDMKLLLAETQVAIPGFPILVQDYITMANAKEAIEKFAEVKCCSVLVLMGMKTSNSVERDLGLINISNPTLLNKISNVLLNESSLSLDQIECSFMQGIYFKQNNVSISRKQILPLVKKAMNT